MRDVETKLKCIRCDKCIESTLKYNVDCPNGGISLRATGNYGSHEWDPAQDNLMFTSWLCDNCFRVLSKTQDYIVFERIVKKAQVRTVITKTEAMDGEV